MIPLVPIAIIGGLGYLGYRVHKNAPKKSTIIMPPPSAVAPTGYATPTDTASTVQPQYKIAPGDLSLLIASRFSTSADAINAVNGITGSTQAFNTFVKGHIGATINLPANAKDNGTRSGATGLATGVSKGLTAEFNMPGFSDSLNQLLREAASRSTDQGQLASTVSRLALQIDYMSVPGDNIQSVETRFGIPGFFHQPDNAYAFHVGQKQMSIILPVGAVDHGARPGASGKVLNHATGQYV